MKLKYYIPIGILLIILGSLFGNIYSSSMSTIELDQKFLSDNNIEYINSQSKEDFPIEFGSFDGNTILVYMNPFCATRAKYLEDWHKLSKNTDDRVVILFTNNMIYYIDYLVRIESRYKDHIYILRDNDFQSSKLLSHLNSDEAVFIVNNKGKLIKSFEGSNIPDSFIL